MNKEVHLVPQTYFLVKLPVACRNEIDRLDGSKNFRKSRKNLFI